MLGLPVSSPSSVVVISSCTRGAPSSIASRTSMAGGRTSYSTWINDAAISAMWALVAATAAMAWPRYNALAFARMFSLANLVFRSASAFLAAGIS